MKNLLDRIARSFGYYTPSEVAACVRDAEKKVIQELASADTGCQGSEHRLYVVQEVIPEDYIRYFVSYNWGAGRGCGGFGCIEIGRSQTIRSQSDITQIVDLIADRLKERSFEKPRVVILNWQPFEPPRQDGGGRETAEDAMPATVVLRLVA